VIRRTLKALAVAIALELCCVAGSLLHAIRLVAHVNDVSLGTALNSRRNATFTAWQVSLNTGEWTLFIAIPILTVAGFFAVGPLTSAAARIRGRRAGVGRAPSA